MTGTVEQIAIAAEESALPGTVDQEAPHLLEADLSDELLDVDASVAEGPTLLVGLGDRRVEGDDALEAGGDLDQLSHVPGRPPRCAPA
jgi:hypothetical protein